MIIVWVVVVTENWVLRFFNLPFGVVVMFLLRVCYSGCIVTSLVPKSPALLNLAWPSVAIFTRKTIVSIIVSKLLSTSRIVMPSLIIVWPFVSVIVAAMAVVRGTMVLQISCVIYIPRSRSVSPLLTFKIGGFVVLSLIISPRISWVSSFKILFNLILIPVRNLLGSSASKFWHQKPTFFPTQYLRWRLSL